MASLVAPLVSGIAGAASGAAEFYLRGTSTTAIGYVFSDRDAQTAVTTHTLDVNGGIERYVTAPVSVIVRDSSGASVRTFTWEDDARTVGLYNAGFTGTSPTTGATVSGGRTTVDAAFSSLFASLGAVNGQVLVNGAGQNITDVIGGTTGVFFNVKTSTYGAAGDGTTDDTSAIQAAFNAVQNAGGGIVYFPPGTYVVSTALALPSNGHVLCLGVTPRACKIKLSVANEHLMTVNGNGAAFMNLGFEVSTAGHLGSFIFTATHTGIYTQNCDFTGGNLVQVALAAGEARFVGCKFVQSEAGAAVASLASGGRANFVGCQFSMSAAVTGNMFNADAGRVNISGSHFELTTSSGNPEIFSASAEGTISGCTFEIGGAGTVSLGGTDVSFSGNTVNAASAAFGLNGGGNSNESGCALSASMAIAQFSQTREFRRQAHTASAGTATLDVNNYGIHEITNTAGACAISVNTPTVPRAQTLWVIYKNTTGGAITPSFVGARTGTVPSVASGSSCTWLFNRAEGASMWYSVACLGAAYTT